MSMVRKGWRLDFLRVSDARVASGVWRLGKSSDKACRESDTNSAVVHFELCLGSVYSAWFVNASCILIDSGWLTIAVKMPLWTIEALLMITLQPFNPLIDCGPLFE